MQLRFNRYWFGLALILLCLVDWAVITVALSGGGDIVVAMEVMAGLMAVAMILLLLMIRPPRVASLDGDTLRVGRDRAHVGDVLRTTMQARSLDFAVRARDADGHWVGAYGERTLSLPLRRVDGGRKAAELFSAFVEVTRRSMAPPATEAPPAPVPRPRRDGIDPDVRPPLDGQPEEPAHPPRAAFGRKGL